MMETHNESIMETADSDLVLLKKYLISLLHYYQKQELSEHRLGAIEALASISLEIERLIKETEEETDE